MAFSKCTLNFLEKNVLGVWGMSAVKQFCDVPRLAVQQRQPFSKHREYDHKMNDPRFITSYLNCLLQVSHVTRNPSTSMRRLWSALWLTHFPVVRSLFRRHAVVMSSALSGTLCVCILFLPTLYLVLCFVPYYRVPETVCCDMLNSYVFVKLRQYSVWLRAGHSGDRGSIPDRGRFFF
jgi:hypothetical protein